MAFKRATAGARDSGDRQGLGRIDRPVLALSEIAARTQTKTFRHRPRRAATAAERQQARDVAHFVYARVAEGQSWLVTLALVSARFPDISLDTALCGYVFRDLLVAPVPPPPAQLLLDLPPRGSA
jgi:hypothetical protein